MAPSFGALRLCVRTLTSFFDTREEGDVARLDVRTLVVHVRSSLDDAEAHPSKEGRAVPAPDGLFEWRIRRDFVRSLPKGVAKTRLSETLAGPRTRRRFTVTLHAASEHGLPERFARFRRIRLRSYAARVLRGFLAEAQSS